MSPGYDHTLLTYKRVRVVDQTLSLQHLPVLLEVLQRYLHSAQTHLVWFRLLHDLIQVLALPHQSQQRLLRADRSLLYVIPALQRCHDPRANRHQALRQVSVPLLRQFTFPHRVILSSVVTSTYQNQFRLKCFKNWL